MSIMIICTDQRKRQQKNKTVDIVLVSRTSLDFTYHT